MAAAQAVDGVLDPVAVLVADVAAAPVMVPEVPVVVANPVAALEAPVFLAVA